MRDAKQRDLYSFLNKKVADFMWRGKAQLS
jgi:hypothetical protein